MARGKKHTSSHRSKASSQGVQAKKHLGQHFLKDEYIAQKIASILVLDQSNNVLEIGPGTGVMTKYLVEQPIDLIAMDLDRESIIHCPPVVHVDIDNEEKQAMLLQRLYDICLFQ